MTKKLVTVLENSGSIVCNGIILANKCFYICLVQGLGYFGIYTSVIALMELFGDNNPFGDFIFDELQKNSHFTRFFEKYPTIAINIYSDDGSGKRYIDTNHCITIGFGSNIINILKCKHGHFEYITGFKDINLSMQTNIQFNQPSMSIQFNQPNTRSKQVNPLLNYIKKTNSNQVNQVKQVKQVKPVDPFLNNIKKANSRIDSKPGDDQLFDFEWKSATIQHDELSKQQHELERNQLNYLDQSKLEEIYLQKAILENNWIEKEKKEKKELKRIAKLEQAKLKEEKEIQIKRLYDLINKTFDLEKGETVEIKIITPKGKFREHFKLNY